MQRGNSYEKRRSSTPVPRELPQDGGLSSSDAHALANEICAEQSRWRIKAIRLIEGGACCLVLLDSVTATEHEVCHGQEWQRLRAAGS